MATTKFKQPKKQKLYWDPSSHLNASYALKHKAPQLVGRLPRVRANEFMAAAKLARVGRAAKKPKLPKQPKATRPQAALSPTPQDQKSFTPAVSQNQPLALPPVPRIGGNISVNP